MKDARQYDWSGLPLELQARLENGAAQFDLTRLVRVLQIPHEETERIRVALAAGTGNYLKDVTGSLRYGSRPFALMPPVMSKAYPFGYGTLAVLADEHISLRSRQKIAYFACQTTDPFGSEAIPYGLIAIVSFLAVQDALTPDLFRSVLLALELAGKKERFTGWTWAQAQALSDWLVTHAAIPEAEKQWWLWHVGTQLNGQYHARLGARLVPYWLAHSALSLAARRELAWGWLNDVRQVGQPPANWRLMAATFEGDVESVESISGEMELDAQVSVGFDEIAADLERAPHVLPMPDPHEIVDNPMGFLQIIMGMRFGTVWRLPGYVRRLAVEHLATTLGTPVTAVAVAVLDRTDDDQNGDLQQGLVAALSSLETEMTRATFVEILERVLAEGKVQARLHAFQLGAHVLGFDYVQRGAADEAASIRKWAGQVRNR